jgi:hypothetical protein
MLSVELAISAVVDIAAAAVVEAICDAGADELVLAVCAADLCSLPLN